MKKIKINFNFGQALNNKRFALIFSFILAVIIWFVITALDANLTMKISNVPVEVNTDFIYEQYGFTQIGSESFTVNVYVQGKSYKVGSLTADHFSATATPVNITEAGIYEVEVKVTQKTFDSEYDILNAEPSTIRVQLGKRVSKEFSLELRADNVMAEDQSLVIGSLYGSDSKITVTGDSEEVGKINKVILETSESKIISQTTTFQGELKYYDENDTLLDLVNIETNLSSFEITVPILKKIEVSLNFQYTNKPDNFDIETELKPVLSIDTIEIAAPLDTAESLSSINIATIDVREIDIGKIFSYKESDISLPAGCQLISEIDEITIEFPTDGMASTTLTISSSNINIINKPANYSVALVSNRLTDVKIVGTQEMIDSLTSDELSAVIDLSEKSLQKGTLTMPVKVYVNKNGVAWANGVYTLLISVVESS